jgi:hypothetical protein
VEENECRTRYDDVDDDGICEKSNCVERSSDECITDGECALVNGNCEQGCQDNEHYIIINGECTIRPGCVNHIIGGKEVWNCDNNYCSEGYDDFDNDGICSPSDCYDRAIEDCNNGCVNDNGECKQSCENKNHYKNVNGICVEKGCTDREADSNSIYPCGEGCIYIGSNNTCGDGITNGTGCELRSPQNVAVDPCGPNCILDYDWRCRETCTFINLYYFKDGKCTLIEACNDRRPNYVGDWPCGDECLLDTTTQQCVGGDGKDNPCPLTHDDEDNDGICEPADCDDRTPSPYCGEDCALLENGTCGQGCKDNWNYVLIAGKCEIKPICSQQIKDTTKTVDSYSYECY